MYTGKCTAENSVDFIRRSRLTVSNICGIGIVQAISYLVNFAHHVFSDSLVITEMSRSNH